MENQQQMQQELQDDQEQNKLNKLLFSIMKGYTDNLIPPLSQFSPLLEEEEEDDEEQEELPSTAAATAAIGRTRSKGYTESLRKERDRRSKMAGNYDLLLSMLPNPHPKATRETVVSETIAYIQSLEKEITKLENQLKRNESKLARRNHQNMHDHRFLDTNYSSSIDVSVSSNNVTFFGIRSMVRPRLLTDIFMVFQNHKAEVLAANVVVDQRELRLTVTAAVINGNADGTIEKIKRDLLIL